ncbi:MAG: hypothetical protein U0Q07_13505 [Acidimicrobiales bacterium]
MTTLAPGPVDRWTDAGVRVLVCDDRGLFRRQVLLALEARPDLEVVAEHDQPHRVRSLAAMAARHLPDVVVVGSRGVDADLPGILLALRGSSPASRLVVALDDRSIGVRTALVAAGAVGLVDRGGAESALADVVDQVAGGGVHLPGDVLRALARRVDATGPTLDLVGRVAGGEPLGAAAGAVGIDEAVAAGLLAGLVARVRSLGEAAAESGVDRPR